MVTIRHKKKSGFPAQPAPGVVTTADWDNDDHELTGIIPVANIGTGTKNSSTVYHGDGIWRVPGGGGGGSGTPTFINIKDAPGVVADISVDDSAAITAAIGTSTAPKVVVFPPGYTYVLKNVPIPSNTVIDARGATLRTGPASFNDAMFLVPGTTGAVRNSVWFRNITFEGSSQCGFVRAAYVHGLLIERCTTNAAGNLPIELTANCTNVRIRGCNLLGTVRRSGININTKVFGIFVGDGCRDVKIFGNTINGTPDDAILVYQSPGGARPEHISICNNTIENYTNNTAGLENFRGGIHVYRSRHVKVNDNILIGGGADTEGIRFRNSTFFTCNGNTVTDCPGSSIAVVLIQQNDYPGVSLHPYGSGEPEFDAGWGTITGNTLINSGLCGVRWVYNVTNLPAKPRQCTITDNTIVGTGRNMVGANLYNSTAPVDLNGNSLGNVYRAGYETQTAAT